MLRIRANQQNQLAVSRFVERLKQHWDENFSHKFTDVSKDEMEQFARRAMREAEGKGIENEDDIVVYADLCLVSESGFASQLKSQEKSPNA